MRKGKMPRSGTSFEVLGAEIETDPSLLPEALGRVAGVAQAIDARFVAGRKHLELAADLALTSEERGTRVAEDLGVEILLYAAATRQIDEAIDRVGVAPDTSEVGLVLIDPSIQEVLELGLQRNDSVLEFSQEKRDFIVEAFEVEETELEVVGYKKLPALVRERVVLSDLER